MNVNMYLYKHNERVQPTLYIARYNSAKRMLACKRNVTTDRQRSLTNKVSSLQTIF